MNRSRSGGSAVVRTWEAADVRAFLLTHWHTWRVDDRGPPVIPDVPTQAEYVLALRRADGWYARTTLKHDGTPCDVELSPPARLLAHIVDEAGLGVAGASVRIRFDGVDGQSEEAVFWNCTPTTSGDDGRVELVAPTVVRPIDPAHLASMPLVCRVTIDAQSYAPFSVEVPLDPGVTRDLGRLVLRARPPDIVVEFPGSVSALYQAAWEVDGGAVTWSLARSVRRDVLSAEHTIDAVLPAEGVELFWHEQDDKQQFGPAHPLPWPAPGDTLRLAR